MCVLASVYVCGVCVVCVLASVYVCGVCLHLCMCVVCGVCACICVWCVVCVLASVYVCGVCVFTYPIYSYSENELVKLSSSDVRPRARYRMQWDQVCRPLLAH